VVIKRKKKKKIKKKRKGGGGGGGRHNSSNVEATKLRSDAISEVATANARRHGLHTMKTEATCHDKPHLSKLDTNSIPPMEVSCGSTDTVRRGIGVINLPVGISKA